MSKLKTGIAIGACLIALGTTSALVGNLYKEDIKDWWNETFKKDEKQELKVLSEGDKLTKKTKVVIDMTKFAEYLKGDGYDFVESLLCINSGSTSIDLVTMSNYTISIVANDYYIDIYCSNNSYSENNCLYHIGFGDGLTNEDEVIEEVSALGTIIIDCRYAALSDVSTENTIVEILGLTIEDDEVKEDLGIVNIYEELVEEETEE